MQIKVQAGESVNRVKDKTFVKKSLKDTCISFKFFTLVAKTRVQDGEVCGVATCFIENVL